MATTLKSFAQSTGKAANQKSGGFSGALLGKMAEGLEALEAIGELAAAKVNRFMELAAQAAHVAKQTLTASKTIPFANPDVDFNPSLNPARAAATPSLGLGSKPSARSRKQTDKKEDK